MMNIEGTDRMPSTFDIPCSSFDIRFAGSVQRHIFNKPAHRKEGSGPAQHGPDADDGEAEQQQDPGRYRQLGQVADHAAVQDPHDDGGGDASHKALRNTFDDEGLLDK